MSDFDALVVVAERRGRKEIKRRQKKKRRAREALQRIEQGWNRPYSSPILDLFSRKLTTRKGLKKLDLREFKAPKNFSISKNPGECIKFLQDIVEYARTARRPRIVLDQRQITHLGLGADSILGVVLSEIRQELRQTFGAYIKGYKPKSKEIQQVMDDVGSVRALFMEAEEDIRLDFRSKSRVFRHRNKSSDDGMNSNQFDPSGAAISDFSDHLDSSLNFIGRKLSVDGRDKLCHYAAEVLDNVREHSGLKEWAIVGYSDLGATSPKYRCVIFCFGITIAESFKNLPENSFPIRVIAPYLDSHRGGSLFSHNWREEDLITLIALQGDVSSKSVDVSSDRGQGTVELINFFQEIAQECGLLNSSAEMNIVSGSTRIRFDGQYQMVFNPQMNRDVIAFNATNDLSIRPDSKAVISLGEVRFPGTLITIEIPLTSSFLEQESGVPYED